MKICYTFQYQLEDAEPYFKTIWAEKGKQYEVLKEEVYQDLLKNFIEPEEAKAYAETLSILEEQINNEKF